MASSTTKQTTHCELLTAEQRGAVAVIRIVCDSLSVDHLASSLFQSVGGRNLHDCRIDRVTYGQWRNEDVVVVRLNPSTWEINCHGGFAATERIFQDLEAAGISRVKSSGTGSDPSDFQQVWQQALLNSRSIRTADLILPQPQNTLNFLTRILEATEVALETGSRLIDEIQAYLSWVSFSEHLTKPWTVAIAGEPNAGKSSLLNAVVGYQRAIVFEQPGTTRDAIDVEIVLDGWPVRLIDTAGIRTDSDNGIEQQGIELAVETMSTADLCLIVHDGTQPWSQTEGLLRNAQPRRRPIVVMNKKDLWGAGGRVPPGGPTENVHELSAVTGAGVDDLLKAITQTLVPNVPRPSQSLPLVPAWTDELSAFMKSLDLQQLQAAVRQWVPRISCTENALG